MRGYIRRVIVEAMSLFLVLVILFASSPLLLLANTQPRNTDSRLREDSPKEAVEDERLTATLFDDVAHGAMELEPDGPDGLTFTDDLDKYGTDTARAIALKLTPLVESVTLDVTSGASGTNTDPWNATFDWEGGATSTDGLTPEQSFFITRTHEYSSSGSHALVVCVNDKEADCDSQSVTAFQSLATNASCPDDLVLSNYQTRPSDAQYVDITNVGGSTINIDNCLFAAFNVFTELSIGKATVAFSGSLAHGETFRVGSAGVDGVDAVIANRSLPTGPGGLSLLDGPPLANGTPVGLALPDNITGMIYLNTGMVFGVAHLRVAAHNTIYECIYVVQVQVPSQAHLRLWNSVSQAFRSPCPTW